MSKKSLQFHIKNNDYFGTLATVLSLWNQGKKWTKEEFDEILKDLMILQQEYIIKRKIEDN